jgi:4,5-dihydroxyphthalate decarboxylase
VRTYTQTTALWIRGILRHEYGVDLDKVHWMTLGDGHLAEYSDPPTAQRLPKGSSIPDMMLNGELAAALLGEDMPKDPRVRTLVPDAHAAAKDWFAREGVVPINHMFVVHEELSNSVRTSCASCTACAEMIAGTGAKPLAALGLDQKRARRWTSCSTTLG